MCGVRNHLSMSERGGTTSKCQAGQRNISLREKWIQPAGSAGRIHPRHLQSSFGQLPIMFWTSSGIREGFGGLCAHQRCSTCLGEHDHACPGKYQTFLMLCRSQMRVSVTCIKMSYFLAWHQTQSARHHAVRHHTCCTLCPGCTCYT